MAGQRAGPTNFAGLALRANGTTSIPNGTLAASGWVADYEDGSPVNRMQIIIDNNFVGKAFGLIMNMDKMVGGDFEKGLAQMKSIAEAAAKQ